MQPLLDRLSPGPWTPLTASVPKRSVKSYGPVGWVGGLSTDRIAI